MTGVLTRSLDRAILPGPRMSKITEEGNAT